MNSVPDIYLVLLSISGLGLPIILLILQRRPGIENLPLLGLVSFFLWAGSVVTIMGCFWNYSFLLNTGPIAIFIGIVGMGVVVLQTLRFWVLSPMNYQRKVHPSLHYFCRLERGWGNISVLNKIWLDNITTLLQEKYCARITFEKFQSAWKAVEEDIKNELSTMDPDKGIIDTILAEIAKIDLNEPIGGRNNKAILKNLKKKFKEIRKQIV